MSPEEVQRASNGIAIAFKDSGKDTDDAVVMLEAPYEAGSYKFMAYFLFDRASNQLSSVNLELLERNNCSRLMGELQNRYGQPLSEREEDILHWRTWRDEDLGNHIAIIELGNITLGIRTCAVQYSPLKGASSGL